jgi:predicted negative regulator of RcsB-dependent stress response
MRASINGSPLDTAEAFVMEKKGDLKGAATIYEALLAKAKNDGWEHVSNALNGRRAAVAFLMGDDAAAEFWSKNALTNDAGANAVMGTLLQKKGDTKGARKRYEAAVRMMRTATKGPNWCLPIYLAESKRAKDGLAEVTKR